MPTTGGCPASRREVLVEIVEPDVVVGEAQRFALRVAITATTALKEIGVSGSSEGRGDEKQTDADAALNERQLPGHQKLTHDEAAHAVADEGELRRVQQLFNAQLFGECVYGIADAVVAAGDGGLREKT